MKKQDFLLSLFKNVAPCGPWMGIDYGMKRIGLALSDNSLKSASPLFVIHKLKELDDLIPKHNVQGFVVGYPLQPDGSEGEIIKQVNLFSNRLVEKYNLPILFIDERLSSVSLEKKMQHDTFIREKKLQKNLDCYVASFLLQEVLKML